MILPNLPLKHDQKFSKFRRSFATEAQRRDDDRENLLKALDPNTALRSSRKESTEEPVGTPQVLPSKLRKQLHEHDQSVKLNHSEFVRSRGESDALANDIEVVINDVLSHSPECSDLFSSKKKTANGQSADFLVEIESVKVNQDVSHVDAFWRSAVLEAFLTLVKERKGINEADIIRIRAIKHITSTLQRKESVFRTAIMGHLQQSRVPRVFFRPADPLQGIASDPDMKKSVRVVGNFRKRLGLSLLNPLNHKNARRDSSRK
jgi:hypothetical protein